jgi:PAS domain S-box-containing protein
MFSSLRTKTIFFLSLLMAITLGAIIYVTQRDVGHAMLEAEEAAALNVLRFIELRIEGEHKRLLSDKIEMIVRVERELKRTASLCEVYLQELKNLAEAGILTKQEAQRKARDWIKLIASEKEGVFISERNGDLLVHTDTDQQGLSLVGIKDVKGRDLAKVMREDLLKDGGDYAVFSWKSPGKESASKKLAHFIPFRPWGWTVAVVTDFEETETESQKRIGKIIEVLSATFKKIQVLKSGYVFLFNKTGEMLIPPQALSVEPSENFQTLRNADTGKLLLHDLMDASQYDRGSITYTDASTDPPLEMQAYVKYFKAFDWFVTVAAPVQEIHQPANALVERQSYLIAWIFLGTLILASVLVSRISRPLKLLASYAKQFPALDLSAVEEGGTPIDNLPAQFKDEVGRLAEAFVLMRSELKKNLVEVIQAETKYRTILESILEGLFETDLEGNLTFINESICSITGDAREEVIGSNCRRFLEAEVFQQICSDVKAVHKTEEHTEIGDVTIMTKDGSQRSIELSIYGIRDQSGSPTGFRGVVRDVTERLKEEKERQRLEGQLYQLQKMEAIATLAGGIAHDFNNVLGVILGYTDLLLLDARGDANLCSQLNEVMNAAKRARDLTRQILTFSRQAEPELRPVRITGIVEETVRFLRASVPTTVEIRHRIETAADIVSCDPTKIYQVVMNLGTNAAHAMSKHGGVLEISLNSLDILPKDLSEHPGLNPGHYVKLTVSDTGHGMDRATMERIFEPYYTTKAVGEGTGLGLAVALGVVKGHGGTITVHSEPGRGTTFEVYLPRLEASVAADSETAEPLVRAHGRVLLVDDEEALANLNGQILEHLGYEVTVATSSITAYEIFSADPDRFDLIITDMTMPRMTGMDLAVKLNQVRPDVPIILCTGFSELITEENLRTCGVREIIMKPFLIHDLARVIGKALESWQQKTARARDEC